MEPVVQKINIFMPHCDRKVMDVSFYLCGFLGHVVTDYVFTYTIGGRPPLHRSTELTTKSPPCEGGEKGEVIT